MTRYLRFEKRTSIGTLGHDVALDGLVLRQRMRRGRNKKTGKVGGGRASSTTTFESAAAAKAGFDKVVKNLIAERFTPVSGPSDEGQPTTERSPPLVKSFTVKGKAKPTSAWALAVFEKKHDVKLPRDYRAFVRKYGAGELLEFVRIHAPGSKGWWKLEALVSSVTAEREQPGFFPFATTGGGDTFGWKLPSEAVFYLERAAPRAKKVAASFDAFVEGLTTNQRFVDRLLPGLDADATFTAR